MVTSTKVARNHVDMESSINALAYMYVRQAKWGFPPVYDGFMYLCNYMVTVPRYEGWDPPEASGEASELRKTRLHDIIRYGKPWRSRGLRVPST